MGYGTVTMKLAPPVNGRSGRQTMAPLEFTGVYTVARSYAPQRRPAVSVPSYYDGRAPTFWSRSQIVRHSSIHPLVPPGLTSAGPPLPLPHPAAPFCA
ncbi:hypothetical protein KM043_008987 [Ampulex compressa]|nr:hypothetical protein KM043_008987 [Ampulex compressa]